MHFIVQKIVQHTYLDLHALKLILEGRNSCLIKIKGLSIASF